MVATGASPRGSVDGLGTDWAQQPVRAYVELALSSEFVTTARRQRTNSFNNFT